MIFMEKSQEYRRPNGKMTFEVENHDRYVLGIVSMESSKQRKLFSAALHTVRILGWRHMYRIKLSLSLTLKTMLNVGSEILSLT